MKESSLHFPEAAKRESEEKPSGAPCYQPRRQLLRITRYWPLRSDHCFIYNIPKLYVWTYLIFVLQRFDALFAIMRQPQLSTVDADKCKQVIHQLVALKDSRERIGEVSIATRLLSENSTRFILTFRFIRNSVLDCQAVREKTQVKRTNHGRVADFIALMKECSLHFPEAAKRESEEKPSAAPCYQPRRQLLRITRYWPLRSDHCFIYNIPKTYLILVLQRFDALFAIMRQPQLSTVDADKCKQVIHQLVALKDSRERIGEVTVATRLLSENSTREEQLQLIFLEMVKHLGNYVNHSEKHAELFGLFLQSAALERSIKLPTGDVVVADRSRMKQQETSSTNFAIASASAMSSAASESRNMSRSNSPLPKKPRKSMYLWKPNETLNLYEYLVEKEERHHRTHWVDFVGRVKAGNRPAHLYPNLDLSTATAKQD
ncbi:hypothetical protein OESDEN_06404 [Oesophagostomum dentatum]|uniref:Protein asunder n=1 Tax=Oesophagostomum dentatum TaxID=61180 RepID=A0A0B1TC68_OESDE|nr:hypothetical protein OESDEN_06404 [Oesophagostomum dentatum]